MVLLLLHTCQLTAHRRVSRLIGDVLRVGARSNLNPFQSTPLCEGRLGQNLLRDPPTLFQSTPLCEGRRIVHDVYISWLVFQSTPLCEGRLEYLKLGWPGAEVSIHAPV